MASVFFYRQEADRCRKLAAARPESAAAQRWRQIAAEYELLAESLEGSDRGLRFSGESVDPMQPQAFQQQQAKARS
jgi:hypothetical protein